MSTAAPLLRLESLVVAAGGRPLNQPLTLDLLPGELVAVTGPSGVGKTTLLRTVVSLQQPHAGRVTLQGREPEAWGWRQFRRRVMLATQKPTLLDLTVEENLRRPFTYGVADEPYPADDARDLMEAFGIGAERLAQQAWTLSVGQQQRVSLIRSLLLRPLVICLDEPTSALDPESVSIVEQTISSLARERGLSALIVTHDPAQAQRWCDRTVVLAPARNEEQH